jgi:Rrf2 family protein
MAYISASGVYGLMALSYLDTFSSSMAVSIGQIAKQTGAPKNYLEQILNKLKKKHIVRSIRGANGGYMLARDAAQIKILEVLQTVEPTLDIANTQSNNNALDLFFLDMQKKVEELFMLSISDLRIYEQKYQSNLHYEI